MATSVNNAFEAGRAGVGAPAYQELLARVDLYSESVVMTRYALDGEAATAYELDPRDLAAAFAGQPVTTGLLPGFVFAGVGDRWLIWAVKAYPGAESERLFHAPLPNVFNDGHICMGNVAFPPRSVQTIREAAQLFFASEFNSDLAAGKVTATKPLRAWLAEIAGAEEFPLDALLPTPQVIGEVMTGVVDVC